MKDISLNNFNRIFDVDDVKDVNSCRKKMGEVDFGWKGQKPLQCSREDLQIEDGQYRYSVESDGVPFECLFFPHESKKLVVSLIGGEDTKPIDYPRFIRWKWYNYFDANVLCIEDPMYFYHKNFNKVMWYYGTKEESFLEKLASLVKKYMEILGVEPEDVIFIGSSGGGTCSIHMANMIAGTCCMALNPQFYPAKWNPVCKEYFSKELGVDLDSDDIHGRNKALPTEAKSRYFLSLNAASKGDQRQFLPMFEELGIPLEYGISQHDNIVTWVHHSNGAKLHSSNPERLGFLVLDFLNEEMKRGKDISQVQGLSYLINEYMNMIHVQRKHIEKHKKEIETLNLQLAEERFSLKHIVAKCRYWVMSKICLGKKRQHYKAKLKKFVTPSGK